MFALDVFLEGPAINLFHIFFVAPLLFFSAFVPGLALLIFPVLSIGITIFHAYLISKNISAILSKYKLKYDSIPNILLFSMLGRDDYNKSF